MGELNAAFQAFKDRYDGMAENVQASIDNINVRMASFTAGGAVTAAVSIPDPEYTKQFASWFRSGAGENDLRGANAQGQRQLIQAAMSVGDNAAGGYLAPVEWDRRVNRALTVISPMRRISAGRTTKTQAFQTVWNNHAWGSGWVGETAARPATSNPDLAKVTFPAGEIYANPAITQRLLDDADFNVEQWLADEIADEFARQEGIAFIGGDGANKPMGLLRYVPGGSAAAEHPGGPLGVSASGHASQITADGLIDTTAALGARYRQNARWLMNSLTAARVAKLKDGQGNYLWRDTFIAGQPSTLLGFPVELDENMPDVLADSLPIAFGDFSRGYLINDRFGVRVLRDPYTNKPYVSFYTTMRVGGGVFDPKAIRIVRVSAS